MLNGLHFIQAKHKISSLIIQWVWTVKSSGLNEQTFNFPINYPNNCWNLQLTQTNNTSSSSYVLASSVNSVYTKSNFTISCSSTEQIGFRMFTIGN